MNTNGQRICGDYARVGYYTMEYYIADTFEKKAKLLLDWYKDYLYSEQNGDEFYCYQRIEEEFLDFLYIEKGDDYKNYELEEIDEIDNKYDWYNECKCEISKTYLAGAAS